MSSVIPQTFHYHNAIIVAKYHEVDLIEIQNTILIDIFNIKSTQKFLLNEELGIRS